MYLDIIDACEINCTPINAANLLAAQPKCELNDNQYAFYQRYKDYDWRM